MKYHLIAFSLAFMATLSFAQMKEKLEKLEKQGFITDINKLNDIYPKVAKEENAATVLEKAFAYYHYEYMPKGAEKISTDSLLFFGNAKQPKHNEPLPDDVKKSARDYLGKQKKAMELLYQASTLSKCRYPMDLSKGYSTLMPHLSAILDGVRMLLLDATLHIEDNKPEQALRAICASYKIAQTAANEPLLISRMLSNSIAKSIFEVCQRMFYRLSLNDKQLTQLASVLAKKNRSLATLVVTETCCGIYIFKLFKEGKTEDLNGVIRKQRFKERFGTWVYKLSGKFNKDFNTYTDLMAGIHRISKLALPQRILATKIWMKKALAVPKNLQFSSLFGNAVGSVLIQDMESTIRTRLALTAIAIERYQLAMNKRPKTLSELVPKYLSHIPKDFDAKALLYKQLDNGYMVYSIGQNGRDEGGIVDPKDHKGGDIVFRVYKK